MYNTTETRVPLDSIDIAVLQAAYKTGQEVLVKGVFSLYLVPWVQAVDDAWQAIAVDVLHGMKEAGHDNPTLSTEDMLELVLESSYLEAYGELEQEELDALRDIPYRERIALLSALIGEQTYGG